MRGPGLPGGALPSQPTPVSWSGLDTRPGFRLVSRFCAMICSELRLTGRPWERRVSFLESRWVPESRSCIIKAQGRLYPSFFPTTASALGATELEWAHSYGETGLTPAEAAPEAV